MKFWDKEHSDAPPVFMLDGVSYLHVKVRPDAGTQIRRSHQDTATQAVLKAMTAHMFRRAPCYL